jgi:hypothetical protein
MLHLRVVGPASPPFSISPNGAFRPDGTPMRPWYRSPEHGVLANRDQKKARGACSLARAAFLRPSACALAGCALRTCDCCSGATMAALLLPQPRLASASGCSFVLGATWRNLPRQSVSSAALLRHTHAEPSQA